MRRSNWPRWTDTEVAELTFDGDWRGTRLLSQQAQEAELHSHGARLRRCRALVATAIVGGVI